MLPSLEDRSIDLILCDLPYGTTNLKWDSVIPFDLLWKQYERVIKDNGAIVLTATQPFASALVMSNPKIFRYEWIWEKTRHTNFLNLKKNPAKKHENILVFYKKLCTYNPQMEKGEPYIDNRKRKLRDQSAVVTGEAWSLGKINEGLRYPSSIQKFANPNNKSLHQTQKPEKLFEFLIKTYTNDGETILDNCIGSGTTAIAALNVGGGRNFIGMEKDWDYCEIANKRIEETKENILNL